MKVTIYDGDDKLVLTNDDVINENFIEAMVNGESITLSIDDLYIAVKAFKNLKKEVRSNDLYYTNNKL